MEGAISRGAHRRKIVLQSFFVSIPMLASSTIIIYIVYANIVNEQCPNEMLCPRQLNKTSKDHYLIDFPAARLAFISSGSATVSFALLGAIMTMYSYINAAALLRASQRDVNQSLPTPSQTSAVMRLLNAEMTVLWDIVSSAIKRVFWHREKHGESSSESPKLVGNCSAVFFVGIVARYVRLFFLTRSP